MDSDDEMDCLMGGNVGQRMSSFVRRKKARLEEDEENSGGNPREKEK